MNSKLKRQFISAMYKNDTVKILKMLFKYRFLSQYLFEQFKKYDILNTTTVIKNNQSCYSCVYERIDDQHICSNDVVVPHWLKEYEDNDCPAWEQGYEKLVSASKL